MPEHVVSSDRCSTTLLATKDEVYPFVQVLLHIAGLQRLPVLPYEVRCIFGPRWQDHIGYLQSTAFFLSELYKTLYTLSVCLYSFMELTSGLHRRHQYTTVDNCLCPYGVLIR
jgi:hypothetical protein